MKYLIAGLGNIGNEYAETRHNIGFKIVDYLAKQQDVSFSMKRLAFYTEFRLKNKIVYLIKPTTYMNLSGKALQYWMNDLKIEKENVLVVLDELALPYGKMKIKSAGSAGGHNGLKNIQEVLQTQQYPRLRFGISNEFEKGRQIDYVLGEWSSEEKKTLESHIQRGAEAVKSFCLEGIEIAMTKFNK